MPKVKEEHLSLVEFTYNNSYRGNVGMAPYEVYGGRALSIAQCTKTIDRWTLKQPVLVVEQVGGAVHT